MIDNYGRNINYLRLSVTQRCNLRCAYCGIECEENEREMTPQDIEKAVSVFADLGIRKVRLTGGEPLVRKDITEIAKRVSSVKGIETVALTTNGVLLEEYAEPLKKAGVQSVNISLDTMDREQYKNITGADCLDKVLAGIKEAEKVGLYPIRINSVLIKGKNDNALNQLIDLGRKNEIDVRFIELMPFSKTGENKKNMVSGEEILRFYPELKPVETEGNSPAKYYKGENFKGRIGLITPVSRKFCSKCNRIRLLSDGKIKPCLGNKTEIDIWDKMHNRGELEKSIKEAILLKPKGHSFFCGYESDHGLNKIGG